MDLIVESDALPVRRGRGTASPGCLLGRDDLLVPVAHLLDEGAHVGHLGSAVPRRRHHLFVGGTDRFRVVTDGGKGRRDRGRLVLGLGTGP